MEWSEGTRPNTWFRHDNMVTRDGVLISDGDEVWHPAWGVGDNLLPALAYGGCVFVALFEACMKQACLSRKGHGVDWHVDQWYSSEAVAKQVFQGDDVSPF